LFFNNSNETVWTGASLFVCFCLFNAENLGCQQPVCLAYQPPASSAFLSKQTSHQQSASSTFLSQQISTNHQPNEQAASLERGRAT
jgi:hypothetical protein